MHTSHPTPLSSPLALFLLAPRHIINIYDASVTTHTHVPYAMLTPLAPMGTQLIHIYLEELDHQLFLLWSWEPHVTAQVISEKCGVGDRGLASHR